MNIGALDIRFLDILDVLVVAYLMYFVYKLVRGTVAFNIFIGVVLLYVTYLFVEALNMRLLSLLLGSVVAFGVIILIIIFQPEVREFLLVLGNNTLKGRFKFLDTLFGGSQTMSGENGEVIKAIHDSLEEFTKTKTGALIVISNSNQMNIQQSGEILNAKISSGLLQSIFFKNAPLHDGAVLVYKNEIKAASCILPLSKKKTIGKDLGLRHRAALGVSEANNVLVIVVSEETGDFAVAEHGVLKTGCSIDEVVMRLTDYLTMKNEI